MRNVQCTLYILHIYAHCAIRKTVLTSVKSDVKGDVKQERGKLWLVVSRHLKPKGTPSHVL